MVVVSRLWLMGEKKREGGNVRWIHKILADGPQNDDTLLFQANGVKFPSTEAPECGPDAIGTGNAAYELKQRAEKSQKAGESAGGAARAAGASGAAAAASGAKHKHKQQQQP